VEKRLNLLKFADLTTSQANKSAFTIFSLMKFYLQILMLAMAAGFVFAEEFCGIIDVPTTWTKENSPYRITGDVQISPGARLTIEEGVEVIIVPGEACGETKQLDWSDSTYISIKAYGPLTIKGSATNPVKIFPENHVSGKIQWDGIRIFSKDRTSAGIEYLHIMGANKAVNARSSNFNVGNSLFIGNSTGIWLENEGDLSVYNCVFTENLSSGIYIKNSRPAVAANIFYKNSSFGIWSDSKPSLRIHNNIFFANADTDCRFCPVGTSKIIKSEDSLARKDKFGNMFKDPIFINSEKAKAMAKTDPNLPTSAKDVKDTALHKIYNQSQGLPASGTQASVNSPPFSLSKYSPALNAAPKTDFFKNVNGSQGDIGLYGGKPNRYGMPISL
jgi:parallel beta-helix repeat protein